MGAELFRQLAALLQRFQGDVKRACQNWGALVEAIKTTYSEDEAAHPFNKIHAFDDVEAALRSTLPLCVCKDEGLNMWIEFIWTVDLDDGLLKMNAYGGHTEWSFFNLYRGRSFQDQWIEEAEIAASGDDVDVASTDISTMPFAEAVAAAAAIQIQAAARRYLEVSRGLRPGVCWPNWPPCDSAVPLRSWILACRKSVACNAASLSSEVLHPSPRPVEKP